MAASTGKTGRGVFIQIGDGESPQVFTTVGNVTQITSTGLNAEEIDFTHLLSTGGFREFQQGFKDAGTVGINYHFDPTETSHTDLFADFVSGRVFDARIDFSGAGWQKYMVFQAFVQNPGDVDVNVDGPITGAATLRRTGATTFEDIP